MISFIIPYRDRSQHLVKFMQHMTPLFPAAEFLVIEQTNTKPFNRGKLLNIGFQLSKGDYVALHDVDMIPVKADYSFPGNPTHLATKASQFAYKMPFPEYFGGVVLISREDMIKCNGYHNEFWGWGGEDDSFRLRVLEAGLKIDSREGIFNSLPHPRKIDVNLHKKNVSLLYEGPCMENGLNNLEYEIIKKEGNIITVEI